MSWITIETNDSTITKRYGKGEQQQFGIDLRIILSKASNKPNTKVSFGWS
jgi:hypothetical protein